MKVFTTLFLLLAFINNGFSQEQFNVFVFTKTAGWHHKSINDGVKALEKLSKKHNFYLEWHEDAKRINDDYLQPFDLIIFLNTTEDILNNEQQLAFEKWYKNDKGFVGIHAASDTEYDWEWYTKLVGRTFEIHPAVQTAKINILNHDFPGLESTFAHYYITDEFYEFSEEKIEGLNYLITLDESTYDTEVKWETKTGNGMGDFHPITWYHEYDGGRSFYTGFGHNPEVFKDEIFLRILYGGIYWAATGRGLKQAD